MKKFAQVLSVVFHPLLVPSLGFLVLFLTNNVYGLQAIEKRSMLWVLVFVFTFFIPAILIFFLKLLGVIRSFEMHDHQERLYPMMVTFISYFAGIFILRYFNAPLIIPLLITGAIVSVGAAGIVSIVWKVSAHLTGMGGLVAGVLIIALHLSQNYSLVIALSVLLSGFVAWGRIYLKAHTLTQVFTGFMLGFSAVFFPVLFTPLFH